MERIKKKKVKRLLNETKELVFWVRMKKCKKKIIIIIAKDS